MTVITALLQGKITNGQVAITLKLSLRQIKRLKKRVREEGTKVLVHQLKGKVSNHHLDEVVKNQALDLVKENYSDFKPKFASKKLAEVNSLIIHPQTLRRWMSQEGLWQIHKQKKTKYRAWRERKEYFGGLQLDFSRFTDNTYVNLSLNV